MFKENKAAQIAAYFLHRAGDTMQHVKLMKLMYLADREALDSYGLSISNDTAYSMRLGPVLSQTLDLMNGNFDPSDGGEWVKWITAKENYHLGLKKPVTEDSFQALSDGEISILRKVYDKYGDWSMGRLIRHTHTFGEWRNPGRGRIPIEVGDVFQALGKTDAEIEAKLGYIQDEEEIEEILACIR